MHVHVLVYFHVQDDMAMQIWMSSLRYMYVHIKLTAMRTCTLSSPGHCTCCTATGMLSSYTKVLERPPLLHT